MTNEVLQSIAKELKTYTGVKQVILANQKIPENKLDRPRITLNWIMRGNTNYPHTHNEKTKGYSEEDEQIIVERTTNLDFTLGIQLFGKDIEDYDYIEKVRDWFEQPCLSDKILKPYHAAVIEVMSIDDLSEFSQTEYQFRYSFDVRINFGKYFEYQVDDIKEVNINE